MKKLLAFVFVLCCFALWMQGQNRPMRGPRAEKVDLPEPESNIYVKDGYRYIEGNGVPDHDHGDFPNRGNPHAILPQTIKYRVPAIPKVADQPTELGRHPFGVALNGIPFDPGTAEYWQNDHNSGWRFEALTGHLNLGMDQNNAHVQPTGSYHYHGLPVGLILARGEPGKMTLVGYAADGFPVYANYGYAVAEDPTSSIKKMTPSYSVKKGARPSGTSGPGGQYDGRFTADWEFVEGHGDLDAFNGRLGPTPEYPEGIYHYYVTEQFPYVSRMYKGTPDPSFMSRGGPGAGGRPGGNRPRGPRPPRR